jgi:hypothetical protein
MAINEECLRVANLHSRREVKRICVTKGQQEKSENDPKKNSDPLIVFNSCPQGFYSRPLT